MAAKPGKGEEEGDLALAPAKPKLKRPPLYRVVLLNDDYITSKRPCYAYWTILE